MPRAPEPRGGLEVRIRRGLGVTIPRQHLRQITARILADEGIAPGARVTLTVVGEEAIRRLNRRYRGVNAPTDVLSFPLLSDGFPTPPDEPPHVGDVVLCAPIAARQAAEYGHALEREIAYLFTHGVLHLLGYDHQRSEEQRVMRAREEDVLAAVGLSR